MRGSLRLVLALLLIGCNVPRADESAAAAAKRFTRTHARRDVRASVAGDDCRVLLIRIGKRFGGDLVESIHYGTGDYTAFGGAEQLAQDSRFRAVIYRDAAGNLRTYGATTRDEAKEIAECR